MDDVQSLAALEGIPEAALPLWQKLLGEPLRTVRDLGRVLRDYQETLATGAQWRGDDDVDLTLARGIGEALQRLLAATTDASPEADRRLLQAAIRYFVIEDDANADQQSLVGFDDDAAVVNAVLARLGRQAWRVRT